MNEMEYDGNCVGCKQPTAYAMDGVFVCDDCADIMLKMDTGLIKRLTKLVETLQGEKAELAAGLEAIGDIPCLDKENPKCRCATCIAVITLDEGWPEKP